MKHIASLILCAVTLGACAVPTESYQAEESTFSKPPLGTITTATVGQELLSQGVLIVEDGIRVPAGTQITWAYTATGGFYPQTGSDATGNTFHSISGSTRQGEGGLSKAALADPVVSLRASPDGTTLCAVTVLNLPACSQGVRFERETQPTVSDRGFQQTLIYNGRIGNRINVAYREFTQSLARPAFSNDVEYDLNASRTISYRGAQIEILSADNNSIRYRVIRNFSD